MCKYTIDCEHDYRIDHECVVCVLCGKIKDGEILPEFHHKNGLNRSESYSFLFSKDGLEINDIPGDVDLYVNDTIELLEKMNVPRSCVEPIMNCFLNLRNKYPNFSKKDLLSYASYISLRKSGYERDIYEVAKYSGTSPHSMLKFENTFLETPPLLSSNYALSFYSKLFNIKYSKQNEIRASIDLDFENDLLNSSRPNTICAANVFHHLSQERAISTTTFCKLTGMKQGTLYRYLRNKKWNLNKKCQI